MYQIAKKVSADSNIITECVIDVQYSMLAINQIDPTWSPELISPLSKGSQCAYDACRARPMTVMSRRSGM